MKLIYINFIGEDINSLNNYELLFSNYDIDDYDYEISCLKEIDTPPFDLKKIIKTNIKLALIQDSCCFGVKHAMDGIVAIRL